MCLGGRHSSHAEGLHCSAQNDLGFLFLSISSPSGTMRKAKSRTYAATRRSYAKINRQLPSSSKSSSFPYEVSMAQATSLRYEGARIEDCGTKALYDLHAVYKHYLGYPFRPSHENNHKDSALACSMILEHCASSSSFPFKCLREKATPQLADSSLGPLFSSFYQKPDVSVLRDGEITSVSLVEIHSSPYEDTIRKAIVTGLDLLRLR